jgi:hypothetical protein
MPLTIPVILGTVRSERVGPRVARYMVRALEARRHRVTLVDPVEYRLPLLDKMYKEYPPGGAPEVLERLAGPGFDPGLLRRIREGSDLPVPIKPSQPAGQ